MEAGRVKAVSETSARHDRGRQWSIHFVDFLLREIREGNDGGPDEENFFDFYGEKDGSSQERDRRIISKGEEPVPSDWDSLELTREWGNEVLACERYDDVSDCVRQVGSWQGNILYRIANIVMREYYDGLFDDRAVGELFYACYEKCARGMVGTPYPARERREILEAVYEYFSRVNMRKCAARNEREGRRLVESCGLCWAGSTYYNSRYYYEGARVQKLFRQVCSHIARSERMERISFRAIEAGTQFSGVGGLSFHGVFSWLQEKDNHPEGQYGMRRLDLRPPERFFFLYRNHYAKGERLGALLLEERMREPARGRAARLFRRYAVPSGREYHNGLSYLLEGSIASEEDDALFAEAMSFLQNFRLYRVDGCVELLRVE